MKLHFLFILFIGLYNHAIVGPYLKAAEGSAPREGFGLLAHWPFDGDYSSSVNNDLYQGRPKEGSLVSIIYSKQIAKVGKGALRLDSGTISGKKTSPFATHSLVIAMPKCSPWSLGIAKKI